MWRPDGRGRTRSLLNETRFSLPRVFKPPKDVTGIRDREAGAGEMKIFYGSNRKKKKNGLSTLGKRPKESVCPVGGPKGGD